LPPGYLTTVTPKFSDQVQEVCSEVVLVRVGVTGLVDSGVDATAHVFDEATENAPIDGRDDETRFEDEFGGEHSIPSEINASNATLAKVAAVLGAARLGGCHGAD